MNQIKINRNPSGTWFPFLVFFLSLYIYFGFFGNYILFYQEKSSLFIFSFDFLKENLRQPGGPLVWLGKFFSTFYYYPLAGSIVLSSVLTVTVFLVSKILYVLTGNKPLNIPFMIGAVLFYLQTDYRFLLFNNLGLLIQLVLFLFVIRYSVFLKGWLPIIITPLCFYFTGGFTWIFLLVTTFFFVFEKEKSKWIRIIALWCIIFTTFYISKEVLFFQPGKSLLIFPFSDLNAGSQQIIFFAISGVVMILPIISEIKFRFPAMHRISALTGNIISAVILLIVLLTIGILQFDDKTKKYFHVEKLFYEDKFDEIIEFNSLNPPGNLLTVFLNNIALCETDKLNDLLFQFQQSPDGKTLFLKWEMVGEILNRGGYFYYTVGMINEAHRWAFENMVMKGYSPEGLKMLIKSELINGNYKIAAKYIALLKKTLFYRMEARGFEQLLFRDDAVLSHPELGEKRRSKVESDFFTITDDPYINIERILAIDSMNIHAFEYKLAFLLLQKDYKGIESELPSFSKFGFTRFPVHVEEAITALEILKNETSLNLGNIQLSINTQNRWTQFLTVFQKYGNNLKSAEPTLKKQFGNTFWYYTFYR